MHQICNSRSLEAPGEHPRGALAEEKQRLTATALTPEAERETDLEVRTERHDRCSPNKERDPLENDRSGDCAAGCV